MTIIYDGLFDENHLVYYIVLSIHTSACLLLLLNVKGYLNKVEELLFSQ